MGASSIASQSPSGPTRPPSLFDSAVVAIYLFHKMESSIGDGGKRRIFEENASVTPSPILLPGFRQSVSESDRRYWSDEMKEALGIGGFPVELILNDHPLLPVPAVQFEKNPESISKLFSKKINIFVSPTEYFVTKFRDIFSKTQIKHITGKESRSWLSGPKMKYWPQQLNFALWCATTGSGISREILRELSQQLRGFFLFHVYFTVRRIVFEMGGIQSFSALPGDPTFNQTENKFDSPSFERICAEFGIDPNTDFRFTHG